MYNNDYDISWDYELDDKLNKNFITLINKAIKWIKKEKLNLRINFNVFPILLSNNQLGIYCNGTYKNAVIGIDIRNIISACKEYSIGLNLAIKTTILHEIRHAWQERNKLEFDEIDAEDYAYYSSLDKV